MSESTVLESINVNKTFSQGGRSIEVLTDLNLELKSKERVPIKMTQNDIKNKKITTRASFRFYRCGKKKQGVKT